MTDPPTVGGHDRPPEAVHPVTASADPLSASVPGETFVTLSAPNEQDISIPSLQSLLAKSKARDEAASPSSLDRHSHSVLRVQNSFVRLEDFQIIRLLGQGDTGRVFLCVRRTDGAVFAVKVLWKSELIKRRKVHRALSEYRVLTRVRAPTLLTLHAFVQTESKLYFFLEFCGGGELFHCVQKLPGKAMSVDAARFILAETIVAMAHLHECGVAYRDIKPENIMLTPSGHCRLADFDLVGVFDHDKASQVGLPVKRDESPISMLHHVYTPAVDNLSEGHANDWSMSSSLNVGGYVAVPLVTTSIQKTMLSEQQFVTVPKEKYAESRGSGSAAGHQRGSGRLHSVSSDDASVPSISSRGHGVGVRVSPPSGGGGLEAVGLSPSVSVSSLDPRCAASSILSFSTASVRGDSVSASIAALHSPSGSIRGFGSASPCREVFASKVLHSPSMRSFVGTLEYMAPDVLCGRPYSVCADYWSLGILLYELVFGKSPFASSVGSRTDVRRRIMRCTTLPVPVTGAAPPRKSVPDSFVSLCQALVHPDPARRLGYGGGLGDIMSHRFFEDVDWDAVFAGTSTPPIAFETSSPTDTSRFRSEDAAVRPRPLPENAANVFKESGEALPSMTEAQRRQFAEMTPCFSPAFNTSNPSEQKGPLPMYVLVSPFDRPDKRLRGFKCVQPTGGPRCESVAMPHPLPGMTTHATVISPPTALYRL